MHPQILYMGIRPNLNLKTRTQISNLESSGAESGTEISYGQVTLGAKPGLDLVLAILVYDRGACCDF